MPDFVDDVDEADVPEQAVRGLNAATEQARAAGHILVYVRDRQLIRESPDGTIEVLRTLPPLRTIRKRPES